MRSSSRCFGGSAWSVASPMPRGLQGRSGHGNRSATKKGRRLIGASRLQTLGRSWHAFTRHNRSGGVLVRRKLLEKLVSSSLNIVVALLPSSLFGGNKSAAMQHLEISKREAIPLLGFFWFVRVVG